MGEFATTTRSGRRHARDDRGVATGPALRLRAPERGDRGSARLRGVRYRRSELPAQCAGAGRTESGVVAGRRRNWFVADGGLLHSPTAELNELRLVAGKKHGHSWPCRGGGAMTKATTLTTTRAVAGLDAAAVAEHCRVLRMPTVSAQFDRLAQEAAQTNQTHTSYLAVWLGAEVEERERGTIARRLQEAKF